MRTIRTTLLGSLMFVVGCSTGSTPVAKSPSPPSVAPSSLHLEFTSSASGNAEAAPVLQALEHELRRSMDEMRKRGDPPPYYMAYEVADKQEVRIQASFGAL